MAERADDMSIESDEDIGTGAIKRTITLKQHHTFNTADWSAMRGQAAQSESAWMTWLNTYDHDAYVWLSGLTSTQRSAAHRAVLREA
jgi:hypothetical protein